MLRSIAAVVAGLVVAVVIVMAFTFVASAALGLGPEDPPTPPYLLLNLLGSVIAGAAGGATAMRIAPHTPHGHVFALAIVILLLSLPTVFSGAAPGQPDWYPLATSVLGPVSVFLGGLLAARRRDRPRSAAA